MCASNRKAPTLFLLRAKKMLESALADTASLSVCSSPEAKQGVGCMGDPFGELTAPSVVQHHHPLSPTPITGNPSGLSTAQPGPTRSTADSPQLGGAERMRRPRRNW